MEQDDSARSPFLDQRVDYTISLAIDGAYLQLRGNQWLFHYRMTYFWLIHFHEFHAQQNRGLQGGTTFQKHWLFTITTLVWPINKAYWPSLTQAIILWCYWNIACSAVSWHNHLLLEKVYGPHEDAILWEGLDTTHFRFKTRLKVSMGGEPYYDQFLVIPYCSKTHQCLQDIWPWANLDTIMQISRGDIGYWGCQKVTLIPI